jgi:hypothetical protein
MWGAIDYVTQYGGINIDNMDDSDGGNQIVILQGETPEMVV